MIARAPGLGGSQHASGQHDPLIAFGGMTVLERIEASVKALFRPRYQEGMPIAA